MKKFRDIALGLITVIGGFVDAGELVTSAQSGVLFQWSLLWIAPVRCDGNRLRSNGGCVAKIE